MTELIHVCTSWPTLVVTTLLGLVVLYWLCVILGALDFDLFDFDVDSPYSYWFVCRPRALRQPAVKLFHDWLLAAKI